MKPNLHITLKDIIAAQSPTKIFKLKLNRTITEHHILKTQTT